MDAIADEEAEIIVFRLSSQPSTAHLVCEERGVVITEAQRRAVIEDGSWEPTATGEPGIRSYYLNELASKFSSLESVAQQAEHAKTPQQKQAFHNTTLARVYDAGTEVELSASELQQRAEPIATPYAPTILFVTAGVDVQNNRLECTFLAHHADGTQTVLNDLKLMSDTSGDAVWASLDSSLCTIFSLVNGRQVEVTAAQFRLQRRSGVEARSWATSEIKQAYAVKGVGGFDRMPLARGAY